MTEQLDYFNKWGDFRGREARSVIHNNGAWHKGVHVWLFNNKGELYLKKRAKCKEFYPEYWEDIGEHLKPGESYEEGARRGLEEELGVKGVKLEKLAEAKMCFPDTNAELIELWKCVYNGAVRENRGESSGGRFFPLQEIQRLIKEREKITPWFKELFYWHLKEEK